MVKPKSTGLKSLLGGKAKKAKPTPTPAPAPVVLPKKAFNLGDRVVVVNWGSLRIQPHGKIIKCDQYDDPAAYPAHDDTERGWVYEVKPDKDYVDRRLNGDELSCYGWQIRKTTDDEDKADGVDAKLQQAKRKAASEALKKERSEFEEAMRHEWEAEEKAMREEEDKETAKLEKEQAEIEEAKRKQEDKKEKAKRRKEDEAIAKADAKHKADMAKEAERAAAKKAKEAERAAAKEARELEKAATKLRTGNKAVNEPQIVPSLIKPDFVGPEGAPQPSRKVKGKANRLSGPGALQPAKIFGHPKLD